MVWNQEPLTGIYPIAPVAFDDNGQLDEAGCRRILDCMIDQDVDGICILANYSEQFLLSDAERETVLSVSADQIARRVPLIVTCSHFSSDIAAGRAKRAQQAGAAMVMVMPPYHGALLKTDETGMLEHFQRIAEAINIPIMIQDAPLAGVDMPVAFLSRLAREIPQVSYLKIEMPGTAGKLKSLIDLAGDHIDGPFDGEEGITLLADLQAGATGTMTSALIPDLIRPIVTAYLAGDTTEAAQHYARVLPVINHENRQCNLRAAKEAMRAGGVIKSAHVRHPLKPLPDLARTELFRLMEPLDPVVLRWGR